MNTGFIRCSQLAESFSFCRLFLPLSGEGGSAAFSSFCFTPSALKIKILSSEVKGEGKNRQPLSACTRSRAARTKRSPPCNGSERDRRKADYFSRKVDNKPRKHVHFFPELHSFPAEGHLSSAATDGSDTKGEHKAIAIRQFPHDNCSTSKEKPTIATKRRPKHLLISKNDFTFAETSPKNTLWRADCSRLMRHFSPHSTPCRAYRRPPLMGYHFSSLDLTMKTLFLLLLAALGFTACTRRVVEHVEVHDTLRLSDTDTMKQVITLTDSVFIHDSTFIENGIPVRSRLIFHRQLIDRTSQHLHQLERDHARRQKTQRSAVRSVPFPFPGATKPWLWVVLGVGVGLGIGKVAGKR